MNHRITSLLLKPTHGCNFNCKYCYDAEMRNQLGNLVMPMDIVEHVGKLSEGHMQQIIFHGGEPLFVGKDWYKQAFNILKRYRGDVMYEMQSNGSLIDEEWIELFKRNSLRVGISYDFCAQEQRGAVDVMSNIRLLKEHGIASGCICVVTSANVNNLREIYEQAKTETQGGSVNFNTLFRTGKTDEHNENMLASDELESGFGAFLDYYIYRPADGCFERTSEIFLSFLFGKRTNLCTYIDCRLKWIGLSPDGSIYPCDRYFSDRYRIGDIRDFSSWRSVQLSDGFSKYYDDVETRFSNHCSKCHFFYVCGGGCNGTHFALTGQLHDVGQTVCDQFYALYGIVYDKMRTADISSGPINPNIADKVKRSGGISLNQIYEFIYNSLGYGYPLQYDGVKSFADSLEYKLFRIFNPFADSDDSGHQTLHDAYLRNKNEIDRLLLQNKAWAESY